MCNCLILKGRLSHFNPSQFDVLICFHGCTNSSDASHLEREPRLRSVCYTLRPCPTKSKCRGISWYKTKIQMQITFASGLFWSNYSIFTKFNVGMISDLRNSSCSFKGLRPRHQPCLLRREFNRENTSTITSEGSCFVASKLLPCPKVIPFHLHMDHSSEALKKAIPRSCWCFCRTQLSRATWNFRVGTSDLFWNPAARMKRRASPSNPDEKPQPTQPKYLINYNAFLGNTKGNVSTSQLSTHVEDCYCCVLMWKGISIQIMSRIIESSGSPPLHQHPTSTWQSRNSRPSLLRGFHPTQTVCVFFLGLRLRPYCDEWSEWIAPNTMTKGQYESLSSLVTRTTRLPPNFGRNVHL